MYYKFVMTPDTNDTHYVTCPDLPGFNAVIYNKYPDSFNDTMLDAFLTTFMMYQDQRKMIPLPSTLENGASWRIPVMVQVKVYLWNLMVDRGKRKADLAKMLNVNQVQIGRLLDFHHASSLGSLDNAIKALGATLTVSIT